MTLQTELYRISQPIEMKVVLLRVAGLHQHETVMEIRFNLLIVVLNPEARRYLHQQTGLQIVLNRLNAVLLQEKNRQMYQVGAGRTRK